MGLLSDSRRGTRPGIVRRCPYPFSLFERSQPLGITGPLLQLFHCYNALLTQKTTGIHRDLGFERTRKRQSWPAVPLFSSYHVGAQPLRPWLAAGSCRWSGRIVELSNCRIARLQHHGLDTRLHCGNLDDDGLVSWRDVGGQASDRYGAWHRNLITRGLRMRHGIVRSAVLMAELDTSGGARHKPWGSTASSVSIVSDR